jgi:hypothetical protein
MSARNLKRTLQELLSQSNFDESLASIRQLPHKQVVSPLISFFYHRDEKIKFRAIRAVGMVVSNLADQELEAARVIMRRLMWNLNDESGGIGWGSPEAMGEIMARHEKLADEFNTILVSYIRKDCNYLEHEMLQRGVIWGIGRLAHARPELLTGVDSLLTPYLESEDAILRGMAAWASGAFVSGHLKPTLENLSNDASSISIFIDGKLIERTVGELAQEALSSNKQQKPIPNMP